MGESWKSDLERWLAPFIGALRHKTRVRMCPAYVAGLIGAGDRKSVQPMAARDTATLAMTSFITSSPAAYGTPRRWKRRCSPKLTGWSAAPTPG